MGQPVHTRVLLTACQLVGGIDQLSVHLDVPRHSLAAWVEGRALPTRRAFLKAIDLIVERDASLQGRDRASMLRLLRQSAEALAPSTAAIEDSHRLHARIAGDEKLLFWQPEFLARGSRREILEAALDAALSLTGADAGNAQVLEPGRRTLRIAVQRGFDQSFLDYFAVVRDDTRCAAAAALTHGRRIVVHDVTASEIFSGSPCMEVLLDARCQAVQCTPLLGPSGRLFGMLSTHYGRPHTPSAADERVLDLIAVRAARWLESESGS